MNSGQNVLIAVIYSFGVARKSKTVIATETETILFWIGFFAELKLMMRQLDKKMGGTKVTMNLLELV